MSDKQKEKNMQSVPLSDQKQPLVKRLVQFDFRIRSTTVRFRMKSRIHEFFYVITNQRSILTKQSSSFCKAFVVSSTSNHRSFHSPMAMEKLSWFNFSAQLWHVADVSLPTVPYRPRGRENNLLKSSFN